MNIRTEMLLAAALMLMSTFAMGVAQAGEVETWVEPPLDDRGVRTRYDIPGDFHKYYGQRRNQYKDSERKIAKIDLDGDFNYDGIIDNNDPGDNGAFQQTPPGLVVAEGELTQLIMRCTPYRVDYRGEAVVTLEVSGINRGDVSGQFETFDEEVMSTSHVRVWADRSRTRLLLDSADPTRRFFEWTVDDSLYPANVPGIVPRAVYLEGVGANGSYSGDCRVLLTVSHRADDEQRPREAFEAQKHLADSTKWQAIPSTVGGRRLGEPTPFEFSSPKARAKPPATDYDYYGYDEFERGGKVVVYEEEEEVPEDRTKFFKRFRTAFDHILVTVAPEPQYKEYIRNNSDGVWAYVGRSSFGKGK